jgi:two-component system phosphate regulon sensor histidine kinase PhoR
VTLTESNRSRGRRFVTIGLLSLLIGSAVAALVWYAQSTVGQTVQERILAELERHASVTRTLLEVERPHISSPAFDRVADVSGAATGVRVTIIDGERGSILGDTAFTPEGFDKVAAEGVLAQRSEVRDALRSGNGHSRRFSRSLKREMIYVASSFEYEAPDGTTIDLVARVGLPAAEADAPALELRQAFTTAGILFVMVAASIGIGVSVFASRRYQTLFEEVAKAAGPAYSTPTDGTDAGAVSSFGGLNRKLSEMIATLSDERSRFADVLNSLGEPVVSIDNEGLIGTINASALALLDIHHDPLGRDLLDYVEHPELAKLVQAGRDGRHTRCEFEYPDDSGGARVLSGESFPRRSGAGSVLVLRDVTELRHLETIRRDFVANVSHELRTPVSIVQASAETLLTAASDLPGPHRNFIEKIQRSGQRMGNLIADLLDLSRLEANRRTIERRGINLDELARQVAHGLENKADSQDCALRIDIEPSIWVKADAGALEQILTNLSENAIKYSGGGVVTLWAEERGEKVALGVDDEGPGIPLEHRSRLFERFYRVDPGRSREQGGTGLGLAIVKHLAEAMNGQVGVDSREPKGTRFWVELEAAQPGWTPAPPPASRPRASSTSVA